MSREPKTDLEDVRTFFAYLTNSESPEHWTRRHLKKLKPDQAFEIIYYLQEVLHVLPDTFELCRGCGYLFDTDHEGTNIDQSDKIKGKPVPKRYWGHWCDDCYPVELMEEIERD